ncbi:hypothetical protein M3A49_06945 [Paraburkholderia sp. CNPSo 3076]|nr:hypothetical protein [Paraburkholderia sp. CNPSo 3076]MCX5539233.1 hypothetical protein [Paraburkholderia sp. CNPSo 3076]
MLERVSVTFLDTLPGALARTHAAENSPNGSLLDMPSVGTTTLKPRSAASLAVCNNCAVCHRAGYDHGLNALGLQRRFKIGVEELVHTGLHDFLVFFGRNSRRHRRQCARAKSGDSNVRKPWIESRFSWFSKVYISLEIQRSNVRATV